MQEGGCDLRESYVYPRGSRRLHGERREDDGDEAGGTEMCWEGVEGRGVGGT